MKLKSVVSVIVLALAVGTIPTAATGASSAAAPTYKRYTVCAKLHKDYPRGIAHPRARVAKGSKYAWDKHPGGKKYSTARR